MAQAAVPVIFQVWPTEAPEIYHKAGEKKSKDTALFFFLPQAVCLTAAVSDVKRRLSTDRCILLSYCADSGSNTPFLRATKRYGGPLPVNISAAFLSTAWPLCHFHHL